MVRLHLQEGRTIGSLVSEYGISKWCKDFSKECQNNETAQKDMESMREIYRLRKQKSIRIAVATSQTPNLSQCFLQFLEGAQSSIPKTKVRNTGTD